MDVTGTKNWPITFFTSPPKNEFSLFTKITLISDAKPILLSKVTKAAFGVLSQIGKRPSYI